MAFVALFTGASGLQANSTSLDVIGNNLANLNTTGFKTSRTLFRDLVYQGLDFGSAGDGTFGGTNAVQLGLGVAVGAIDTVFQQGSINPTTRPLDAAISGPGFFTLATGQRTVFSRSGAFSIDANGFLVDAASGFFVQRNGSIGDGDATSPVFQVAGDQNIRIPFGTGVAGVPTENIRLQGNLDANLDVGDTETTAINIFDSQSQNRVFDLVFTKTAINEFTVTAAVTDGTVTIPPTTIQFDTSGILVGPATITATISGIPGAAPQNVILNLGVPGSATGLSQFGGATTANAVTQDGSAAGTLASVSIDNAGVLQGQFTNGRTFAVAQLAIAGFNNEGGLLRIGDNYFSPGPGSGQPLIGAAGIGGRGTVQGSALESANVDIAIEFSRLIVAQRGFQVNARTITAANESLQELANIIR